jgi:DNA-binding MarR family transcriptional regulator
MDAHTYEERIVYLLRRIAHLLYTHSRQLVRRCGLTAPQLVTLHALMRNGDVSANELARVVALSPSTLTGILDRLEAKGLVERSRSLTDRRSVTVAATGRAEEWFDGDLSLLSAGFSSRLEELSPDEKESIVQALHRLAALLGDPGVGAEPPQELEDLQTEPLPLGDFAVEDIAT